MVVVVCPQEEVKNQHPQSALTVLDNLVAEVPELKGLVPVLRTRIEIWNQVHFAYTAAI